MKGKYLKRIGGFVLVARFGYDRWGYDPWRYDRWGYATCPQITQIL